MYLYGLPGLDATSPAIHLLHDIRYAQHFDLLAQTGTQQQKQKLLESLLESAALSDRVHRIIFGSDIDMKVLWSGGLWII